MAAILILLAIGLYFLPTMIAMDREHEQTAPILVVNLFLGWTLIGWVAALAWSVNRKSWRKVPYVPTVKSPPPELPHF